MKLNHLEKLIGSVFYTGYIPFASGTFGSLAALFIYLIPGFENITVMLIMISFFTIYGIELGTKFENIYGKDPAYFTLDELVGMWISLLMIPKTPYLIISAFIIWRVMDILKPFPANLVEKIKGGYGIMFDDIIAGIYSLILVHIIVYFTY